MLLLAIGFCKSTICFLEEEGKKWNWLVREGKMSMRKSIGNRRIKIWVLLKLAMACKKLRNDDYDEIYISKAKKYSRSL